ncbi:peptidoglycan-associated lipoprotein Pal [Cereibacter azotoformans]|uniref:Peptidoglycan-associated lipoprotein n=1 Tax=Cereibacter azotoformans TaxID=43057 RepID=A0A2T5JXI2_9RHOB|nr:peptidoglycan-associated lipoprotein Pal [Cereibacter azotoformans]AXQ92789.1 peptidoglycan-associated lipoprotein Pal [Cereibacter sphaeroides]MBO4169597.1 peptidoglycan-associated lipoprotein Pal [Cereibacter azotoformans]PTR14874.1 peptidoglycan-associated lipoprotein [Cereibacter azotoformans]UIJ31072.1 peptidoglycan-associated lipoprotein Pal [Cereibacter azotoformans]
MTHLPKALILLAALGLAACNNPDRYGAGGAGGAGGTGGYGAGGYGAGGIDSQGLGGPSDPRSIAYFQQTLGDRVFFLVDQSTLNDSARATLDTQSQWLMANADYAIIIEGHADEQGTREYNLALGARRASAVQDYLISKGIAPSRMKTVSYGKERPVEVCSTEECYSKNRRAVTVLSMGAGV